MSDYKTIQIDAELHKKLKLEAINKEMPLSKYIHTLLDKGMIFISDTKEEEFVARPHGMIPVESVSSLSTVPKTATGTDIKKVLKKAKKLSKDNPWCEHFAAPGLCKKSKCKNYGR